MTASGWKGGDGDGAGLSEIKGHDASGDGNGFAEIEVNSDAGIGIGGGSEVDGDGNGGSAKSRDGVRDQADKAGGASASPAEQGGIGAVVDIAETHWRIKLDLELVIARGSNEDVAQVSCIGLKAREVENS